MSEDTKEILERREQLRRRIKSEQGKNKVKTGVRAGRAGGAQLCLATNLDPPQPCLSPRLDPPEPCLTAT
jgi:hypothetical protein